MSAHARLSTRLAWGQAIAWLVFMLAACGLAARAGAAIHCIRAGATGNGSGTDWVNACPRLPERLVRGDTYYVAAGAYPAHTFDDPEEGDKAISIRKATAADHGTTAGWSDAFGQGVAVWGPLNFSRSRYVFDGATGRGRTDHGFEIFSATGEQDLVCLQNAPHHITLSHVQMHFASRDLANGDAIYGDTPAADITVAHCYIHDIPRCPFLFRHWRNVTVEHNWIARNKSTAEIHAEGVSTHGGANFIFRNNVWQDIEGTAVIVNLAAPSANWKIYGNIFFQTNDSEANGLGHGIVSDNFEDSGINGLEFYNNSIFNIRGGAAGLQFWSAGSVGIKAFNNLWCRCENVAFNQVQYDYNTFASCTTTNAYMESPGAHDVVEIGDPFVDVERMDFHLIKYTEPGLVLPAPFQIDMEGRLRAGDGGWDRGALEFPAALIKARPTGAATRR